MSSRIGIRSLRSWTLSDIVVRPRPLGDWTLLGVSGVVLTVAVLGLVGGLTGVALALVFIIVWLFLPTVYSYATGHVLALGATASALSVVELLFVEVGLLAVLFGPLTRSGFRNRGVVARSTIGFTFVLFSAVVIGLALRRGVWLAAGFVSLAGTVLAYGVHRYELTVLASMDNGEVQEEETEAAGTSFPESNESGGTPV